MQAKALSRDGYIINQEHTGDIPYGRLSSDINGCGWMAAFNFFKAAGRPRPAMEIKKELEAGSTFHGSLGTGPCRLRRYIEKNGYLLRTAATPADALLLARSARVGCLFYIDGREPHFVTFVRQEDGQFRFFNAIPGEEQHIVSMPDFFQRYVRIPVVYMMVTR